MFGVAYAVVTLLGCGAGLWGLASFTTCGGAVRLVVSIAVIAFFVVLYTAITPIF